MKPASISAPAPIEAPKRQKPKKKRKVLKWVLLGLLIVVLVVGGYFTYKLISTSNKVFSGNPLTILTEPGKKLQADEYGRSNILVFGTSEDDPGHPGAELTDSIMVISVDQEKKDAFMVSIPRDLNVEYGRICTTGALRGKINDVYQCAKIMENADEQAAQQALREKVGEVTGLDIQYSAHVNYSALKQAVDAVGGITVMIESSDPRGISERYVNLPNGPAHLNGEAALALARARNAEGGYGLPRSNFDREQYQQKILVALRDKAASAGTLTNPVAVSGLIDALGDNVRTNFEALEVKTLVQLAADIPSDKVQRLDLNNPENPVLNGDGNPIAGDYEFTVLHDYINAYSTGEIYRIELPVVAVLNASEAVGAAAEKADELEVAGFTIASIANAPEAIATREVILYDLSMGEKPHSLSRLESAFHTQASKDIPAGLFYSVDFIIVVR